MERESLSRDIFRQGTCNLAAALYNDHMYTAEQTAALRLSEYVTVYTKLYGEEPVETRRRWFLYGLEPDQQVCEIMYLERCLAIKPS